MTALTTAAFCLVALASSALAQTPEPAVNRDPGKVKLVTSDINNFWRAYDLAAREPDEAKRTAIFQTEYLDKGSAGLQDFVRLRIKSAKDLAKTVNALPGFYASVRPSSMRVSEMDNQIRKSFHRFKALHPDAVFPDVYFLVGVANTGGTASRNGLLIGTELYGLAPQMPRDEFTAWFGAMLPAQNDPNETRLMASRYVETAFKPVEKLPAIVAHESCHFNQKIPEPKTLLGKAIQEGSCDFIGELIAGDIINPRQKAYGDQHEATLWRQFQSEMNGTSFQNWMYNLLRARDRPSDLGYYIGYKISESYYNHARDKRQAIRDILEVKDYSSFLEKSRYQEKFAG